ncbi:MAG: riboflavin synthase [Candidatus Krumholzibacteria bacterium]|nr:riboflavin synthase [Candidatus Krumholzibacteria bacterium]
MFTGLVEDIGTVVSLERSAAGARLTISSGLDGLDIGESISINGACQTVAALSARGFSCDVLTETLRATNLGRLKRGAKVNLERAMPSGGRLGGHLVNGHVDGVGTIVRIARRPLALDVAVEEDIFRYIVSKGSIALNGVSLTIGPDPARGRFEVFIVPHTWENTNLKDLRTGSRVNVEVDILAKYIEAFMRKGRGENR